MLRPFGFPTLATLWSKPSTLQTNDAWQRDRTAQKHERDWKASLPHRQGKCVVGVVADEEDAALGLKGYLGPYVRSVLQADGEPRLIFPNRASTLKQMQSVDAILLPGGADIHPVFYDDTLHPGMANSYTDPVFDAFELRCIDYASENQMPMLGICRGQQAMVVADQGRLYQHLPKEFKSDTGVTVTHTRKIPDPQNKDRQITDPTNAHPIVLDETSRLYELLGKRSMLALSRHHQAAVLQSAGQGPCMVGLTLVATAVAMDGTVEAVERPGLPQLGVQFHAEGQPDFHPLFEDLVANGAAFHRSRSASKLRP